MNVVGGMRLDEPAADLPVILSLVSALRDVPISEDTIAFGEVGLSGEVRNVSRAQMRVNEAARLGFKKCILPKASMKHIDSVSDNIELIPVRYIREAIDHIR